MLCEWIRVSPRRTAMVVGLEQPLTAMQASRRLGTDPHATSFLFWELAARGVTACVNPSATTNRLHWLTEVGLTCRDRIRSGLSLPPLPQRLPDVPWSLYAELLFRHRSAVVLALTEPMRPSHIRRRAMLRDGGLRMSANNTRDVVRFLVENKVAQPVPVDRQLHPWYELTELGARCRQLLTSSTTQTGATPKADQRDIPWRYET